MQNKIIYIFFLHLFHKIFSSKTLGADGISLIDTYGSYRGYKDYFDFILLGGNSIFGEHYAKIFSKISSTHYTINVKADSVDPFKLTFTHNKKEIFYCPIVISLSLSLVGNTSSLLHSLYLRERIDSLTFFLSIRKVDSYYQRNMIFGGKEEEYIQNKTFFKCKVKEGSNRWGCPFEGVCTDKTCNDYFDNSKFSVLFEPIQPKNIAPYAFLEFLKECLKDEFESGNCESVEDEDGYEFLKFKNETQYPIDFYFIKDDKAVIFSLDLSNSIKFYTNNNTNWILNDVALNQLELFFDYDNRTITFISEPKNKLIMNTNIGKKKEREKQKERERLIQKQNEKKEAHIDNNNNDKEKIKYSLIHYVDGILLFGIFSLICKLCTVDIKE